MKKIFLRLIISFTVILFFVFGYNYARNKGYESGWNDAKERLKDVGFSSQIESEIKIHSIAGKIIELSDKKIIIKANPLALLASPSLNIREIKYNTKTKIKKYYKKDKSKYQKELDVYNSKILEDPTYDLWQDKMPSQYEIKEITWSELKVDNSLNIKSSEDIKSLEKFIAEEITVMP